MKIAAKVNKISPIKLHLNMFVQFPPYYSFVKASLDGQCCPHCQAEGRR